MPSLGTIKFHNRLFETRNMTLQQFLDHHYLSYVDQHHRAAWNTRYILTRNFQSLMIRKLDDNTPAVLDKWREQVLSELKHSTINRALSALKTALGKAGPCGLLRQLSTLPPCGDVFTSGFAITHC